MIRPRRSGYDKRNGPKKMQPPFATEGGFAWERSASLSPAMLRSLPESRAARPASPPLPPRHGRKAEKAF